MTAPYPEKHHTGSFFPLLASLLLGLQLAISPVTLAAEPSAEKARELIRKVEDMYRSSSSHAELTMTIVTPHWERTMNMEAWSRGTEDSLIRILSPRKDAGITTLKVGNEMWNYFPKINKTIKVPPSMMMGSWMGSDFTNDDLVKESQLVEEYNLSMEEGENRYIITLVPKEETATVWAKIRIVINRDSLHPVTQTYYDENGQEVRVMEYSDPQDFGDRTLPSTMTMTPTNKEKQHTTIEYQSLELDVAVDDDLFTLRSLKQRSR